MRLAVPDLISNSYFPAISAVELGYFAEHGLDVRHELIFPVDKSYQALRDGEADFIGGSVQERWRRFAGIPVTDPTSIRGIDTPRTVDGAQTHDRGHR